jgi:tRNA(His) 5'-end guanylyltransferase
MKDDIGTRLKDNYENRAKTSLIRRMPVIVRIDGKGFSKFCRRFAKPYDRSLHDIFNDTIIHLCHEVSGTIYVEHHSDEISMLLNDYQSLQTEAYFDYGVQKMTSVIAGLTTAEFCKQCSGSGLLDRQETWPSFDCRVFNLPKEEVENYFWWRMKDSTRGSINMLGQATFSHKELQGKNCSDIQEMLFKVGINWNNLPAEQKAGLSFIKVVEKVLATKGPDIGKMVERSSWKAVPSPASRTDLTQFFIDNGIVF